MGLTGLFTAPHPPGENAAKRKGEYTSKELDRSVVAPNQIRTVLETYKNRVFTELFPDRTGEWLPKTLIFAKDDNHAEEIVHALREVFGEGNDFAKKITYRNTGEKPKELIRAFRVRVLGIRPKAYRMAFAKGDLPDILGNWSRNHSSRSSKMGFAFS